MLHRFVYIRFSPSTQLLHSVAKALRQQQMGNKGVSSSLVVSGCRTPSLAFTDQGDVNICAWKLVSSSAKRRAPGVAVAPPSSKNTNPFLAPFLEQSASREEASRRIRTRKPVPCDSYQSSGPRNRHRSLSPCFVSRVSTPCNAIPCHDMTSITLHVFNAAFCRRPGDPSCNTTPYQKILCTKNGTEHASDDHQLTRAIRAAEAGLLNSPPSPTGD